MKKWTACNRLQQLFCTELIGLATIHKQYKNFFEHQIELNMLKGNANKILQVHLQVQNGLEMAVCFEAQKRKDNRWQLGTPAEFHLVTER